MKNTKKKNTVLRLLTYIKPHWYLIVSSTVGGVLKLTLPLILPQVLQYFTDDVLVSSISVQEKLNIIFRCLIFLLILYTVVQIPATYFRESGAMEVSNRVMHQMRCEVYAHLQKMSASFHKQNKSGDLVTRVNNDVEQIHSFVWSVATNVWIDSIILFIYIWLMARINVILTIVAAIAMPLSVLITKEIRKHIRSVSKKVQSDVSRISGYMQERMAGYETVKLFNMEQYEAEKFHEHSDSIYRFTGKRNRFVALGVAVTGSMTEVISAIIVCMSAYYIVMGKMTIGELIAFYSYLGYLNTPLRRFAELNVTYARSIAGIDRVFEILDTPLDIQEKPDAIALTDDMPMNISLKNVWFQYEKDNEDYALEDINIDICEGETVALVGSSGCGKTTLVHLLTRFYDIDRGNISIAGNDLCDINLESLYQRTGMVFQDTVLFSGTIEENIRYGKPDATKEELIVATKAANAYDFIMSTPDGFDTLLGERGIGLSGGQKQRIAISRVFLRNPKLLILDEATSALDSESEELVQEALEKLMNNRTSIVIAHRLSTIINADRIVVMDHGKVLEIGKHEDLLAQNGRYAELYHMQFKDVLK
ncbi:MAG: ABC transporter ATP-binding protein [Lachnospiraceae bacterium]|nr:ABC transporter ATP-binding protein [Lachnospiraceae bacterium]